MAELQPVENAEVIALEEHVDTGNELGWVDPFSSREWTARQLVYAEVLENRMPIRRKWSWMAERICGQPITQSLAGGYSRQRRSKSRVTLRPEIPRIPAQKTCP